MQTGFDQPLVSPNCQKPLWWGDPAGQVGPPINFAAGFVDLSLAHPNKLAFEPIDLTSPGPIKVIIEQFTCLKCADF